MTGMRIANQEQEPAMAEPTIICPNCKTEIKLTESLAAPLIEGIKSGQSG